MTSEEGEVVLMECNENLMEEKKRMKMDVKIHGISYAFSNIFAAVEYDSCRVCWKMEEGGLALKNRELFGYF